MLDADLRPLRRVQVVARSHDWVNLRIVSVQDLDGDGRVEVVLSASQWEFVSGTNLGRVEGEANIRRLHDNSVIVLDNTLRPLARCVLQPGGKLPAFEVLVATNGTAGGTTILALGQKVAVLRFRRR